MEVAKYICDECFEVYEEPDSHKCARAMVGNCYSFKCCGELRDLDRYFCCAKCGSAIIQAMRPKHEWKDVIKSFKANNLGIQQEDFRSRPNPTAGFWRTCVSWVTRLAH